MISAAMVGSVRANEGSDRVLPPLVLWGATDEGLYLYGQVNKGVLVHDDGQDRETYYLVDNDNSSTRFGAWLKAVVSDGLDFSANFEFEWTPYSTENVNRLNRNDIDWETKKLRKAEAILTSDEYGRLWLGQGSMASDGASEADLSGTSVAAYSLIADSAAGQLIAFSGDAGLSDIQVGAAFGNLDGLGRKVRARYDTPSLGGLRLNTSIGSDRVDGPRDAVWDVGARYAGKAGGLSIAAALAFADLANGARRVSASASLLHRASGLNVTVATGYEDRTARQPTFVYGKVGWRPDLVDVGATAFAVDGYLGRDFSVADSHSKSIGVVVVQTVDYYQTDFFVTARLYDFDEPSRSYEDAISVLTGVRWTF